MVNALRTTRRKLMLLAVPLLLGGGVGAAPIPAHPSSDADLLWYNERFYSDATYTVIVGRAFGTCDGEYVITDGYATPYSVIVYRTNCP